MFSLFIPFFFPTCKAHFTFILQTQANTSFTQLLGIWFWQILLLFSAYGGYVLSVSSLILSLNYKSSVQASVNIHFLPTFFLSIPLDSLVPWIPLFHPSYPFLTPPSASIYLYFSFFLRPRFNSIVERTTSVSLTSNWLFMGERKSPITLPDSTNKIWTPQLCNLPVFAPCDYEIQHEDTKIYHIKHICLGLFVHFKLCILCSWLLWRESEMKCRVSISSSCHLDEQTE